MKTIQCVCYPAEVKVIANIGLNRKRAPIKTQILNVERTCLVFSYLCFCVLAIPNG